MSALDAVLTAYADREGRAMRRGNYLHRRLCPAPMALVGWQLGGEPYAFAAIAFGTSPEVFALAVPGQPLNRELSFESLIPLAEWFNLQFEAPWGEKTLVVINEDDRGCGYLAPSTPQVVVPNLGTVKLLQRLGRRLAYLPTEASPNGPPPAPPVLVRFGRHLAWLVHHFRQSGQQILVDLDCLLAENWATPQTASERANLAALEAWINPPAGLDGFHAAAAAEILQVGPIPTPSWEQNVLGPLMEDFDAVRAHGDVGVAEAIRRGIEGLYRGLAEPVWDLVWRAYRRERLWSEAPRFVERRVEEDRLAYSWHMNWMDGPVGGRRRTRDNVSQAIRSMRAAENAKAVVEAEEACSDPIRLIPYLLDGKAIEGEVVAYDGTPREIKPGNRRATAVPLVLIRTKLPCRVPVGKELWWTEEPRRVRAVIESVRDNPGGNGSNVALKILDGARISATLSGAKTASFSVLTTKTFAFTLLPSVDPFTHVRSSANGGDDQHIEPEGDR